MVSKMHFINIVGLPSDFISIVLQYIIDSPIELVNPLKVIKNSGFVQESEINPYGEILRSFTNFFDLCFVTYKGIKRNKALDVDLNETCVFLDNLSKRVQEIKIELDNIEKQKKECDMTFKTLAPILDVNVNVRELIDMKFMKFRFGRMPIDSYKKMQEYLSDLPTYFVVVSQDKEHAWGFYFVYHKNYKRIDNVFSSIYFERIRIVGDTDGSPTEIVYRISIRKKELEGKKLVLKTELENIIKANKKVLIEKYSIIKYYFEVFDVKRFAAYSSSSFYLCGWMAQNDAFDLLKRTKNDQRITVLLDEAGVVSNYLAIPTKIKNFKIFSPFEEFIKMYGIPRYNEVDPTMFLSITYILFFGMMFGDVGHGFCLFLFGFLLTFLKKGGFLAKILSLVGISSTFFGFMYGTFFGFEGEHGFIKPIWFTPMESSFNMNKILLGTVFMGVGTILISMIINILNSVKQKNYKKLFFSQNGMAGFIFYSACIYLIFLFLNNNLSKNYTFAAFVSFSSLLMIFLQEPLGKFFEKKAENSEKRGWFIESLFELLESILGYVTNTISFSRVGTFALSHAGIMSVIILFMKKFKMCSPIISILGNIFVISFEGLIVGIQVLRLAYYEMFSRFYSGDGVEFKPINAN